MKIINFYILLFFIITATGCSSFRFNHKDDLSYIDALSERHEYTVAIKFIDKQQKTTPNYKKLQRKRPTLLKKSLNHQKNIIEKSKKLVKTNRWSDSIELLEDASLRIYHNGKILKELKRQKGVRDNLYSHLKYQLIIHEANSVKEDRRLYQRLHKLDSNTPMGSEISDANIKALSDELLEWAEKFTLQKQAIKARKSLKLAGEVDTRVRKSIRFKKILQQIIQIEKGISIAIKKNRQRELEKQINEFNHQFDQNNLVAAQHELKDIESRFGKTTAIKKLRKRIDSRVVLEIRKHMEKGNGFYSKEKIELAITEWGDVLLLDPDNQKALKNISRAVKVLEQLQKVRANQKR